MVQYCPICGAEVRLPEGTSQSTMICQRCGGSTPIQSGFGIPQSPAYPPPPGYSSAFPPGNPANPYQSPNPWADAYIPGMPLPYDRGRALTKVKGPAILLQVYGVFLGLSSVMLAICLPFMLTDASADEKPIMAAIGGASVLFGAVFGIFTFFAGMRFKAMRSYTLVMVCVVVTFLVGLLACLPLVLLGIWPLVVLLDAEVKAWFDRPTPLMTGYDPANPLK